MRRGLYPKSWKGGRSCGGNAGLGWHWRGWQNLERHRLGKERLDVRGIRSGQIPIELGLPCAGRQFELEVNVVDVCHRLSYQVCGHAKVRSPTVHVPADRERVRFATMRILHACHDVNQVARGKRAVLLERR